MNLPNLPLRAAYLTIDNASRRNALSIKVLRSLRDQLVHHNTGPSGTLRLLPNFQPRIIDQLEKKDPEHLWLLDDKEWQAERKGLPTVLVLRSTGPVFSAGHDISELRQLSHDEVKETFALCAEVMRMIRHSPSIVVGAIQGLATAAGAQLALTTDFPIALAATPFCLPGAKIGFPCTSPASAVSRRVPPAQAFRMLAMADNVRADQLNGAVDIVDLPSSSSFSPSSQTHPSSGIDTLPNADAAFEARIAEVVNRLASSAGQPTALSKWAFWTQLGLHGRDSVDGGDGYGDAVEWTGRMMALHARTRDAGIGIGSFLEKRKGVPEWVT